MAWLLDLLDKAPQLREEQGEPLTYEDNRELGFAFRPQEELRGRLMAMLSRVREIF